MAALKLITSGVSFFSHALMAARKRDDVQSYTDASHFTEEMSCQLLPQRGSCDDLRLALGARAFPPTREEGCLRLALGARAFPTRGKGSLAPRAGGPGRQLARPVGGGGLGTPPTSSSTLQPRACDGPRADE